MNKNADLTKFSLLLAIEAIFCFTPLGSLPALGPIVMTLAMIPVIVTAIVMNTKYATLMGFFAGLFSFIYWTFVAPSPMSVIFTPFYSVGNASGNFNSLIICFVPRILTGTFAGLSISLFKKYNLTTRYGLAGLIGSLTNTFGVLIGIALFFGDLYASMVGQSLAIIIATTIITNGIPEAVLSTIVSIVIAKAFKK